MSNKQGKIAPIQRPFGDEVNTMDQQLAKSGYNRAPGTVETYFPYKEMSGRYRTGFDVEAPYLNRLSKEDKEAEIARIISDKERIEKVFDIPGLLDATSPFWNAHAPKKLLMEKFGADLHVSSIKLGTEEEVFNLDDMRKEIDWNWMKVHPMIAPSLDAFLDKKCPPDTKYYVVDDEAETRKIFKEKKIINKAIIEFEDLTPTKKKQIARLMGLPVTESTREETVYNLIDSCLKQSEFKDGKNKGFSTVRLFNELLKTTDARLKVKDLVEQALTHSVYRIGVGSKITEGGVTIASTKEELVEFLLDDKNQLDLIALEKKLTSKKIERA